MMTPRSSNGLPWYGVVHIGGHEPIIRDLCKRVIGCTLYAEHTAKGLRYAIYSDGKYIRLGVPIEYLENVLKVLGFLEKPSRVQDEKVYGLTQLKLLVNRHLFAGSDNPDISIHALIRYLTRPGVGKGLCGFDLHFKMNYGWDYGALDCHASFDMKETSSTHPLFTATHPDIDVAVMIAALQIVGVEVEICGDLCSYSSASTSHRFDGAAGSQNLAGRCVAAIESTEDEETYYPDY